MKIFARYNNLLFKTRERERERSVASEAFRYTPNDTDTICNYIQIYCSKNISAYFPTSQLITPLTPIYHPISQFQLSGAPVVIALARNYVENATSFLHQTSGPTQEMLKRERIRFVCLHNLNPLSPYMSTLTRGSWLFPSISLRKDRRPIPKRDEQKGQKISGRKRARIRGRRKDEK